MGASNNHQVRCRCCLIGGPACVVHQTIALTPQIFRRSFAAAKGADKKKAAATETPKAATVTSSSYNVSPVADEIVIDTTSEAAYSEEALKLKGRTEAEISQMPVDAQISRIKTLEETAGQHLTMDQFEDAELIYSTCVTVREKLLPKDDLDTAKTKLNYGFALQNVGKREQSIEQYKNALDVIKKHLGEDHYKVGEGLLNYAEVLSMTSNFEEAIKVSQESIKILKKNFRPESEYIGAALNNLGSYYAASKNYQDALPIVKEAVQILKDSLGPESSYTKSAVANQIQLLKDLNKTEEANNLTKEWESIHPGVGGITDFAAAAPDPSILEKFSDIFEKEVEIPKSFDLKGFFKDKDVSKDQLLKFIDEWTKANPNVDPVVFKQMILETDQLRKQKEEEAQNGHETIKKV